MTLQSIPAQFRYKVSLDAITCNKLLTYKNEIFSYFM